MSEINNKNGVSPAVQSQPMAYQVPAGYRLVPDVDPPEVVAERRLNEVKAWVEKGPAVITQEEADKRFPDGGKRFRVVLKDGNGHPEVVVNAYSREDAIARYNAVCGINGWDHTKYKHDVSPVGQSPAPSPASPKAEAKKVA